MIHISDSQLVRKTLQGDHIAFGRLIGRYYESIYQTVLQILKDPLDAEEVTQDAFWKAYLSLESLENPSSFYPWLRRRVGRVEFLRIEDLPEEKLKVGSFEDELLRRNLR